MFDLTPFRKGRNDIFDFFNEMEKNFIQSFREGGSGSKTDIVDKGGRLSYLELIRKIGKILYEKVPIRGFILNSKILRLVSARDPLSLLAQGFKDLSIIK